MKKLVLSRKEILDTLPAYDEHILFALERRYLDFLDLTKLELSLNPVVHSYMFERDLRIVNISEITYQGSPDIGLHLQNFQNILSGMRDYGHNFILSINKKYALSTATAAAIKTPPAAISLAALALSSYLKNNILLLLMQRQLKHVLLLHFLIIEFL